MCANGEDVCQDRLGQLVSEAQQSANDAVQTDLRGQTPGEWPLPGVLDERRTLEVADNQCLTLTLTRTLTPTPTPTLTLTLTLTLTRWPTTSA